MAQHKAPTAVTLAATSEKSGLALFVEKYWRMGALLALGITAVVLFSVFQKQRVRQEQARGWDALLAVAKPDALNGLGGVPEELLAIAEREKATEAGPWGLFVAARAALEKRDFPAAEQLVQRLRAEYPQHALQTQTYPFTAEGPLQSASEALSARISAAKAWSVAHPTLFENAPPPADAPRVAIHTDQGDIVVQLYPALAPKHVENFMKLAREGLYSGTRIHAVRKGSWIQAGDPSTRDVDVSKWGTAPAEVGPEREVNELRHFAGVLSMWKKPGEATSSSSQFLLTTGPAHSLDGQNVVFGAVVEGRDVLTKIENAPLVAGTERPETPTVIQTVEVP